MNAKYSYDNEIWKDIPDYLGLYQCSNLGRVKSLNRFVKGKHSLKSIQGVVLKQSVINSGYFVVGLSKNNKKKLTLVHQLMAITFLGHIPNGRKVIIDHINNIKTDNIVENLQITTQRENSSKDRINKTSKYTGVYFDKHSSKWRAKIYVNNKNKYLGSFDSEYDAHISYQTEFKKL